MKEKNTATKNKTSKTITLEEWKQLTAKGATLDNAIDALLRFVVTMNNVEKGEEKNSKRERDMEKVLDFFDVYNTFGEEAVVPVPALDLVLKKYIREIPSPLLVAVAGVCYKNVSNNLEAVLIIVKELVARKDIEAQIAFSNIYLKSLEYYDAGHRVWGSTVQDQLTEIYFPKFASTALVPLLSTSKKDLLSPVGDGMDVLFVPALKGSRLLSQKSLKQLEKSFLEYCTFCLLNGKEEHLLTLINSVRKYFSSTFQKLVSLHVATSVRRIEALKILKAGKHTSALEKVLMSFGNTITIEDYFAIRNQSGLLSLVQVKVSFEALKHYFDFYVAYLMSESAPKQFDDIVLITKLLSDYCEESRPYIVSAYAAYSKKYKGDDSWSTMFEKTLYQFLLDDSFEVAGAHVAPALRVATEARNVEMNVVLSEVMSSYIAEIVTNKDPSSSIYKNFISILKKNKITIRFESLGESLTSVDVSKKYIALLPYISMSKDDQDNFYAKYCSLLIQNNEWKLLSALLPSIAIKKNGKFVLSEIVSGGFADGVASGGLGDNNFLKKCLACLTTVQLDSYNSERVLAQLLGMAVNDNNTKVALELIGIIPKKITWNILAYNLACYYAKTKNKKKLISTAKLAISLGKKPQQFLIDKDFESYADDFDFIDAIDAMSQSTLEDNREVAQTLVSKSESKRSNK